MEAKFKDIGGVFYTPWDGLENKLESVRAFVFDWDGVFNSGTKILAKGSSFTEPDAMGLNMLRFSYYLKHGHIPPVFIISGANNQTAVDFAKREHLKAVLINFLDKREALEILERAYSLIPKEIAFIYDDVLDLGAVSKTNVKICVNRTGSPLFKDFIHKENLVDYITGNQGGSCAVREVSELLIGLYGNYGETIKERMNWSEKYGSYLDKRQAIDTKSIDHNDF